MQFDGFVVQRQRRACCIEDMSRYHDDCETTHCEVPKRGHLQYTYASRLAKICRFWRCSQLQTGSSVGTCCPSCQEPGRFLSRSEFPKLESHYNRTTSEKAQSASKPFVYSRQRTIRRLFLLLAMRIWDSLCTRVGDAGSVRLLRHPAGHTNHWASPGRQSTRKQPMIETRSCLVSRSKSRRLKARKLHHCSSGLLTPALAKKSQSAQ